VHLTQTSQNLDIFSTGADSLKASSVRSHRGRGAINLPDRGVSTADSISDVMDDMSDLLNPGFDDSNACDNPLDLPFEDFDLDSIVSGSEPAKGAGTLALSRKTSSKAASVSASLPGGGSSLGGASSQVCSDAHDGEGFQLD
jgi:hypothetical protein